MINIFFLCVCRVDAGMVVGEGAGDEFYLELWWISNAKSEVPIAIFSHGLCWGLTAQSTQWGHVESGQFT